MKRRTLVLDREILTSSLPVIPEGGNFSDNANIWMFIACEVSGELVRKTLDKMTDEFSLKLACQGMSETTTCMSNGFNATCEPSCISCQPAGGDALCG